jgi:hypothetical protein
MAEALGKRKEMTKDQMRHELAKRILAQEYTPISIRFDLGQRRRKSEALLRPHESLDPTVFAQRIEVMKLVGQQAKDNKIKNESLSRLNKELLGIRTTPAPDVVAAPAAGAGGAPKSSPAPQPSQAATPKRPRAASDAEDKDSERPRKRGTADS